jgi:adenosylmethionine-8-amino-7-oxononanoate aminotransferase
VTLCTGAIFEAHLSQDRAKTFFHSSSYTANPIACAAAVANLEVWESEPVRARIATLACNQEKQLASLKPDRRFTHPRQIGTIAAVDLAVRDPGYLAEIGQHFYRFALDHSVLLRPLGNTIYVMPPYCISPDELDFVYEVIRAAPDKLEA